MSADRVGADDDSSMEKKRRIAAATGTASLVAARKYLAVHDSTPTHEDPIRQLRSARNEFRARIDKIYPRRTDHVAELDRQTVVGGLERSAAFRVIHALVARVVLREILPHLADRRTGISQRELATPLLSDSHSGLARSGHNGAVVDALKRLTELIYGPAIEEVIAELRGSNVGNWILAANRDADSRRRNAGAELCELRYPDLTPDTPLDGLVDLVSEGDLFEATFLVNCAATVGGLTEETDAERTLSGVTAAVDALDLVMSDIGIKAVTTPERAEAFRGTLLANVDELTWPMTLSNLQFHGGLANYRAYYQPGTEKRRVAEERAVPMAGIEKEGSPGRIVYRAYIGRKPQGPNAKLCPCWGRFPQSLRVHADRATEFASRLTTWRYGMKWGADRLPAPGTLETGHVFVATLACGLPDALELGRRIAGSANSERAL